MSKFEYIIGGERQIFLPRRILNKMCRNSLLEKVEINTCFYPAGGWPRLNDSLPKTRNKKGIVMT